MDKLKKYLEQREVEMEIDIPDDSVWQRIESHVSTQPSRAGTLRLIVRVAVAACIAGMIVIGAWLISRSDKKAATSPELVKNVNPVPKDSLLVRDTSDNLHQQEIAEVTPPAPVRTKNKKKVPKPRITDEITKISDGYNRLFNYQLKQLRATAVCAESPDYFSVFVEQLRKMDNDERLIRADFNEYGFTSELLEQLINLYQQKLNVLKSLQAEINKMNNKVKEKQGPSKRLRSYYLDL